MHGPRVIGAEAFAKAMAQVKAGVDKFGPRVRGVKGATPAPSPGARTEHGKRIPAASNDAVSIEELSRILSEGPTFFDGLYETELSRAEGARPGALMVFLAAEKAGKHRADMIEEITGLLGAKGFVDHSTHLTDGETPVEVDDIHHVDEPAPKAKR